ncbi:MAG: signal recognition particle-docking protein FtsY [Candidatus Adiutrix sp.]|jgi:fused signal recognition particle receptor|nr:signal recognition particle-docking protein FtsY [Candidatus Adiutrix sp.]
MFKWFRKKNDPELREESEAAAKNLSETDAQETVADEGPAEAVPNTVAEAEAADVPENAPEEAPASDLPEATAEENVPDDAPESVDEEAFPEDTPEAVAPEAIDDKPLPRKGLFARFKSGLSATREKLAGRIENLLSSVRSIDDAVLDELEELLITADLGVKTTTELLYKIRGQVAANELRDPEALKQALKKRMGEMLALPLPPPPKVKPLVIMVVGINGVGKTTTIAKLTKRLQCEGRKVLLAAGDTFRSAAVDQLTIWAERLGADIVSQPTGSKSSAVVFDAVSAAQTRGSDVVIIDTAGRLHTKINLMDELIKIKRVAGKALEGAPHHTILVLDGNTGQNALLQAQTFHQAVGVDSIIMTKLDGTGKGGVIVAIANELKIPITYIGLGESFDDLQPFDPEAFTEAILS